MVVDMEAKGNEKMLTWIQGFLTGKESGVSINEDVVRDIFATLAMYTLMKSDLLRHGYTTESIGRTSYEIADSMI